MILPKVLVIVGPTASGKSDLAVKLAKKFNGEIISADSRQVYKGLDIGTGKITEKEMQGIPHYLLDVASPKKKFTVQQYKTLAEKAIRKILKNGKLPIIVGGTGFYVQTLIDNISFPEVNPNPKLRKELKDKTPQELFAILLELDHQRASVIDPNNPHRLIRAIEIAKKLGKVPAVQSKPKYTPLFIGIETEDETLKERIKSRLLARIDQGMLEEAERLHTEGLTWKRMEELGLEYRYMARYLQETISKEEMIEQLNMEIWHYAKRQKTWFKRDNRIKWLPGAEMKKIDKDIKAFLK